MPEPLVSVITPAYNVGPWIGAAVDSVLAQTERRFEYLVVDDGSTDETAEIVRARTAADDRVRLLRTANGGSGAARNVGLAAARAPFVAFLDGDDRWHRDFLRDQLAVFDRVPARVGAVFCHSRVMLENGQVVGLRWQPSGGCDLDRMLAENCPPHNGSSLVIRRSCFEEAGVFDAGLRSAVDFEMWLRIGSRSRTPLFWGNRRYLVDMRLGRPGSISSARGARFAALDGLLATYAPRMRRLHPGLAYVRPAVFAYRDGFDEIADRWAAQARLAGTDRLARSVYGQSLLAWSAAGPSGRAVLRSTRDRARSGLYRGVGLALNRLNERRIR
ncbi:MAG TPA: glycosyltransferase [Pseudonocardia sp.]|nr:glycosyltransferase [Pseudonocardia sp.]